MLFEAQDEHSNVRTMYTNVQDVKKGTSLFLVVEPDLVTKSRFLCAIRHYLIVIKMKNVSQNAEICNFHKNKSINLSYAFLNSQAAS